MLPPPGIGAKDTLICDTTQDIPGRKRQNPTLVQSVTSLIEFSRQVFNPICPTSFPRCDTSYLLSIARPTYTTDWELDCSACSGEVTINANLQLDNDCPALFGRLQSQLVWTNDNGDTLGITQGNGNIVVTQPGLYCAEVEVTLDGQLSCILPTPECIEVPEALFPDTANIDGPDRLCRDSIATYTTTLSPDICDVAWEVSDNGSIINDTIINDSAFITISWDTAVQDTGIVCIDLKSDCGITTSCFLTRICPISTDQRDHATSDLVLFASQGWLQWSGLKLTETARLSLISTDGRIIQNAEIYQERGRLRLTAPPPGIYLIHWQIDGHKQGSQKIYLLSE